MDEDSAAEPAVRVQPPQGYGATPGASAPANAGAGSAMDVDGDDIDPETKLRRNYVPAGMSVLFFSLAVDTSICINTYLTVVPVLHFLGHFSTALPMHCCLLGQ